MSFSTFARNARTVVCAQLSVCFALFVCILFVSVAKAQQAETGFTLKSGETTQSGATQLFEASGLRELIADIPASTASAFESSLTTNGLPARFESISVDSVRHAVRQSFTSETFDNYLIKELDQAMSEQSVTHMLAWYASPLGLRVKLAELDNSLLNEYSRFEAYQQQLVTTGVETQREQIIYRMDEIISSTEAAVDMMADLQIAFNISLSRFLPKEQQLSRAEIQRLAKQNRSQLMAQYKTRTREVLLFTYQDFSNVELKQINKTLATPAGQQFVTAINNGIKKGLFASSLDLGDELGALLGGTGHGPGI